MEGARNASGATAPSGEGRGASRPVDVLIGRYFGELLNAGDFERAGEILAPGFTFYGPTAPGGMDREGFAAFVASLHRGFSDKHFVEIERLTLGDRAVSRFRMTGTHDGTFQGIAATGRPTDVEGCDVFYLRGGRIAEARAYFDLLSLLIQIGAAPAPPATGGGP